MEPSKKPPVNPATIERTPREIKAMKVINIFIISFIAALVVGIVACALNGLGDIASLLGAATLVCLWNYRIIRKKYARGL